MTDNARIFLFAHRFEPLIALVFAGSLYGEMREPTIRRSSVPMLHTGRDINCIAGEKFHRFFSPFLIITSATHAHKYLTAAFGSLVYVPIITATGFESNVRNGNTFCHDRCEIALTDEIFGVRIVRFADRKNNGLGIRIERTDSSTIRTVYPHLFGHTKRRPCFGPTSIERSMSKNFCDFSFGHPVLLGRFKMILERRICQPL